MCRLSSKSTCYDYKRDKSDARRGTVQAWKVKWSKFSKLTHPPWRPHLSLRCTAFIIEDNVVRLKERSAWEEAKRTVSKREQVESSSQSLPSPPWSLHSSPRYSDWYSKSAWNDCKRDWDNARWIVFYAMEMQRSQFSKLFFLPEVLGWVRDALVVISKQSWSD